MSEETKIEEFEKNIKIEEEMEKKKQEMRENALKFEENTGKLKKTIRKRNRKLKLLTCCCSIQ